MQNHHEENPIMKKFNSAIVVLLSLAANSIFRLPNGSAKTTAGAKAKPTFLKGDRADIFQELR
jgi:hypothetical protein